jgi:hypothetical protein
LAVNLIFNLLINLIGYFVDNLQIYYTMINITRKLDNKLYWQLDDPYSNQFYNQLSRQLSSQLSSQLGRQLHLQLYRQLGNQLINLLKND